MSGDGPLMPKAIAVWLIENTALTFKQISDFCKLHPLEVKGLADCDLGTGIRGVDPVISGQLTREEIDRGERDPSHQLKLALNMAQIKAQRQGVRKKKYTPLLRRHDRPNAILWLIRNHPGLKNSQIIRLVGTTKHTIEQIRDRTHWNYQLLKANDPVTLGLCTQVELDREIQAVKESQDPLPAYEGGQRITFPKKFTSHTAQDYDDDVKDADS